MANLDYNHQLFISQFIDRLREEGFYLNKAFDETKGGRFFKEGYKDKKKAFGKYRFCDASSTPSGNPLIIYTYFGLYDKSGNEISKPQSNNFWWPNGKKGGYGKRRNNQQNYKKVFPLYLQAPISFQHKKKLDKDIHQRVNQSLYLDFLDIFLQISNVTDILKNYPVQCCHSLKMYSSAGCKDGIDNEQSR